MVLRKREIRLTLCAIHFLLANEKWPADDLLGLGTICDAHAFNKLSSHACHLSGYAMWAKADGVWPPGVYHQGRETDINQMISWTSVKLYLEHILGRKGARHDESLDLRYLTWPGRSEKAPLRKSQLCWKQMGEKTDGGVGEREGKCFLGRMEQKIQRSWGKRKQSK